MSYRVAVIIPIYKSNPTDVELGSFRNTCTILKAWDIIIQTYSNLDISIYISKVQELNISLKFRFFDEYYFGSAKTYNELLMSKLYYDAYLEYDYILICHLDAWVFSDKIEYWASKDYDIIGAPWFTWSNRELKFTNILNGYCGNGGFTLRKVKYFRDTFTSSKRLWSNKCLYHRLLQCDDLKDICSVLLKFLGFHNSFSWFLDLCSSCNEDLFWCTNLRETNYEPLMPPPEEALYFSFEVNPSILYQKSGGILPFGCHGFIKNEFETFWHFFIK